MMAMMFPIILLGLGVDYFVHILGEFTQRRGDGEDIETALKHTLKKTGRGVLTGGLTTAIAFLALAFTTFKGFTDFGVSAGIGVLCTLLTSFLVLPAALVLIHRFKDRRAAKKGVKAEPKKVIQFRFLAAIGTASYNYWPVTLAVVAVLTAFLGNQAAKVGVATNMFDVEAENLASIELNDVLEERFYLHPDSLVVSASSLEESWALTDGLDDLSTVNMVDSISYVLPPPDEQEERTSRVEELRGRIEWWDEAPPFTLSEEETEETGETSAQRVDAFLKALYQMDCNIITIKKSAYMAGQDRLYKKADALVKEGESCVARVPGQPRPEGGWPRIAASEDMKAIAAFAESHPEEVAALLDAFQAVFQPEMKRIYTRMANPEPITLESLPQTIRDRYQSTDGTQFLVTAYPSGDVWETEFQDRIFAEVATVSDRVTGMPPLFVATIERGAEEGANATLYALIAITVLLLADFWWLSGGRAGPGIVSSALALVPLVIGTIWTVGCMTLLDIDINVANIIAIPLILGIGIDNGVHVIHRYRLEGEGQIETVLNTVGRSIMLTSLTTIAAFGTFAFGLYRGLATMGVILGLGIAICFFLAAFLLPALFRPLEKLGVKL
jgi:predicted RND superfamily exporter protein